MHAYSSVKQHSTSVKVVALRKRYFLEKIVELSEAINVQSQNGN